MRSSRLSLPFAYHSIFAERAQDMKRLRHQHFHLFLDLRNTFEIDRLMVVNDYKIHQKPQALDLMKEVLPLLREKDRYELVMQNIGLISTSKDAVQLFRRLFKPDDLESTAAQRYDFAEAILPALKNQPDLYAVLPHVNKVDHESLKAKFATQECDLLSARLRSVSSRHT